MTTINQLIAHVVNSDVEWSDLSDEQRKLFTDYFGDDFESGK